MGVTAIASGREAIEAGMQNLHDTGKWKWIEKKVFQNHNVNLPDSDGLLYSFQKPLDI